MFIHTGTNNEEQGDDLVLVDGSKAASDMELQQSYELTGHKKCLDAIPRPKCDLNMNYSSIDHVNHSCRDFSLWAKTNVCSLIIDPRPFIVSINYV